MKHATMVVTSGRDEVPAFERMATELAMGGYLLAQQCWRNLVPVAVLTLGNPVVRAKGTDFRWEKPGNGLCGCLPL
jgi:hypothetical protein